MVSPKILVAITEHSMCQPGRPCPQGLFQETSPSLAAFQRAKSSGFSLMLPSPSTRPLAPTSRSSKVLFANLA